MAAVRSLNRIHRESANGVGEAAIGRLHGLHLGCGAMPDGRAVPRPLEGEPFSVNACGLCALCVVDSAMDDSELTSALSRAEQALRRVERAISGRQPSAGRDQELRAKVREVVDELDVLIREAAA